MGSPVEEHRGPPEPSFPLVDRLCDEFEAAWRAGHEPRLETFLEGHAGEVRRGLLRELLLSEWDLRQAAGLPVELNDYLGRFAADSGDLRGTFHAWQQETASGPRNRPGMDTVLANGTTLGSFEIVGFLGAGAMGEVYRARDPKLGREVAVKVLPEVFAREKDRVARFEREARVLASLDHPGIAAIYDVGEVDGLRFLVMQLVEGPTLAARLSRRRLSVEEALPVFTQIAEALEAAHERGVVHRDLKPLNIKLADDGKVSLLDFGLAKALEAGLSSDGTSVSSVDTGSESLTTENQVLGTPAYMSPEQASAAPVDQRTDIWAFGCCLYEALVGRRPFRGETRTELLAAILSSEADWDALPPATPARVRVLLWRCLQKDPRRRLRDIGEARFEIGEVSSDPSGEYPDLGSSLGGPLGPTISRKKAVALALVLFGLLAVTVAVSIFRSSPSTPRPVARFALSLPTGEELYTRRPQVAISPDGTKMVFVAGRGRNTHLLYRSLEDWEFRRVGGMEGTREPFFSPDGEWLGFWANQKLWKIRLEGTVAAPICDAPGWGGASWGPNDTIYFSPDWHLGVMKVAADGSALQVITSPSAEANEYGHWFPKVLADGETVLFTIWKTNVNDVEVGAYSVNTGRRQTLVESASFGCMTASGHLVYSEGDSLFAVDFDPRNLAVGRDHRRVLEGLHQHRWGGSAPFAVSRTGTLVYVPGRGARFSRREIVWVDRDGSEHPVRGLTANTYTTVQISPDGSRLALTLIESGLDKIAIHDLESGRTTKLAVGPGVSLSPIWRPPDGKMLAFTSGRGGPFKVFWMELDEDSPPEILVRSDRELEAVAWSRDGKKLIVLEGINDLKILSVENPGELLDLQVLPGVAELKASFSPSDRWVAFTSNEEGRWEIYARDLSRQARSIKISDGGGHSPLWSPDGKEIFYHRGDSVMVVPVEIDADELKRQRPVKLFSGRFVVDPRLHATFDYDAERDRFLLIKTGDDEVSSTQFNVVLNWLDEVEGLFTGADAGNQ